MIAALQVAEHANVSIVILRWKFFKIRRHRDLNIPGPHAQTPIRQALNGGCTEAVLLVAAFLWIPEMRVRRFRA